LGDVLEWWAGGSSGFFVDVDGLGEGRAIAWVVERG